MLRRVARVLRVGLFALGIAVIAWLPFSFFYRVGVITSWPSGGCIGGSSAGIAFITLSGSDLFWGVGFGRRLAREPTAWGIHQFLPQVDTENGFFFNIPLWLLAFLCLAWPVTSFIIARRRKGRGFEVEPAGTSNIEHPTSNIEAP